MKASRIAGLTCIGVPLLLCGTAQSGGDKTIHWPQFRGPSASGIAEGFPTPSEWDVPSGRNVKWKTPIPGLGYSSPAIWGDRIFLTTAVSKSEQKVKVGLYGDIQPVSENEPFEFRVICVDKANGKVLWDKLATSGVPKIKRHPKASHANCTPATDGRRVVAFFGSEGLYCYDMSGELKWKKDFGVLDAGYYVAPEAQWGFASSPIIYKDLVIVQCDVQSDSFIAALDLNDGREVWKTPRLEVPTWCTPTVHEGKGRTQVIANGYKVSAGYDVRTGKELWRLTGGGDIPVPTPVVAHDLIFLSSAHGPMAPIYAIFTTAEGDITPPDNAESTRHIAWLKRRGGNYMQTLLVYGDLLYACNDAGMLSCYGATDGERHYDRQRLTTSRSGFTASGVAADGKLYFTSEDGDVYVVKPGKTFEPPKKNVLGEICMATPAISEGVLYFRTQNHLIAIAEK